MVVTFHLHSDPRPIATVRPADIRALAQRGSQRRRLRAIDDALFAVVEALYLATEPAA